MPFAKRHVLLLVGGLLVVVVTGSAVHVALRHPDYTGLGVIVYLLRALPSLLITNTARYELPFLASLFLVTRKYAYAGIASLIGGLNWTSLLINSIASYPQLAWIGVRGIGLLWLSDLGMGIILLLIHVQRVQLPAGVTYTFIGMLITTAFLVAVSELLYWTTSSFGYL
jgi:hypothetical protein